MKLIVVCSQTHDAHKNQALEAALTEVIRPSTVILYLWANDNAVFIGKHQNAFLECNTELLKADGGVVARRITGGGAVYHDKGNLNFSFIAPRDIYDQDKQFLVILKAIKSLGLEAELNGRNDVTISGKKFSGNAFFRGDTFGLHHGTILINAEGAKLTKYLSISKLKLKAKGVSSVASRVINLAELNPSIDREAVQKALIKAAEEVYNAPAEEMPPTAVPQEALNRWYKFCTDQARINGNNIFYDARIEHRFDWGTSDIRLKFDKSKITAAKIYSDCLDTDLIEKKEKALIGQDIYAQKNNFAADIINAIKTELKS